ncbi:MAG: GNAT family N-acetyltransferase [Gordonia sp. (in: high G+C Gram-positive bacteria)]|uniref:GNAT family N-acetyltransferase n=1 Tax=Gordonia sp. (in: high G+C Gram-positive bacteria) TaxID=84139 RepID=UPI0039E5099D
MNVEPLSAADFDTAAFRRLLFLASDYDDTRIQRTVDDELPTMAVIGTRDGERVTGFAAYLPHEETVVLEYIATAEDLRGGGVGRTLVEAIRQRHPGAAVLAETDDDAVDFYRAIGFLVRDGEPDPRWPGRRRYECLLQPAVS